MGSDWPELPLEDVCLGIFDCPHSTPKLSDLGPYMVRTQDIRQGFFDTSAAVHVGEEVYKERTKRVEPQHGDLLFSREGTYFGDAAEVPLNIRVCLGQRMVLIRPDQKLLRPSYLRVQINSAPVQLLISQRRDGTVAERLNLPAIKSLPVRVPPLDFQDFIMFQISCLERKIELNRQMNATLEAIAQALFKSWFVDFDPVIDNALAAGNPIPEPLQARAEARKALGDQRKPLPEVIQKQFCDRFVFNDDLGWVPEGWKTVLSGAVIDVRDGTHDSPKQADTGYPLVTSKHITSGKLHLNDTYLISKEDYEQVNQRSKVEHGDILLTMIGTVGIPYLVMPQEVSFAIKNIGLFRTSETDLYRYYFYLLLKTQRMQNYLDARIAGTTQKYLSLKVLRSIEFLSPKESLLKIFNREVQKLIYQIQRQEEKNQTLAKLRDTLLPKLLSGQLRITEAEKRVAGAF